MLHLNIDVGRRVVIGIFVAALLQLAACAKLTMSKDSDTEYARKGTYVGGGISAVDERFEAFDGLVHDADEVKPGLNLRAGYRFHPRISTELVLQTYSEFDVEILGVDVGGVEAWALTGNIKGYLSTSHFQPYGFLGLGLVDTDNSTGVGDDGSDTVISGGFGADYYFDSSRAMFFDVGYYHPTGDTDEFEFLAYTIGFNYRF